MLLVTSPLSFALSVSGEFVPLSGLLLELLPVDCEAASAIIAPAVAPAAAEIIAPANHSKKAYPAGTAIDATGLNTSPFPLFAEGLICTRRVVTTGNVDIILLVFLVILESFVMLSGFVTTGIAGLLLVGTKGAIAPTLLLRAILSYSLRDIFPSIYASPASRITSIGDFVVELPVVPLPESDLLLELLLLLELVLLFELLLLELELELELVALLDELGDVVGIYALPSLPPEYPAVALTASAF